MAIVGGTVTYSGDPEASSLDKVRFLIGDTNMADPQLSDEEILWLISSQGNIYNAAAMACEQIVTLGRLVDKKVGDFEIRGASRARDLMSRARSLRLRGASSAVPYSGGISRSDKQGREQDSDRVRPAFHIGQFDSPGIQAPRSASTST